MHRHNLIEWMPSEIKVVVLEDKNSDIVIMRPKVGRNVRTNVRLSQSCFENNNQNKQDQNQDSNRYR